MRVLLLTPPMTQINTPYPATAYLTGFLRARGYDARQADIGILTLLQLLTKDSLTQFETTLRAHTPHSDAPKSVCNFLFHAKRYQTTVEAVVRFLQGGDPALAHRMVDPAFLPWGPRFKAMPDLDSLFGQLGLQDRAQYLASLYIDDLNDTIRDGIDPNFEISRYGERLAASAPSFDPLVNELAAPPTLVGVALDAITESVFHEHSPDVVGLTVPFPGNLYGALRIAKKIRELSPKTSIVLGGGYVNTELRELSEPRLFDLIDYVTLDDGERPFLTLLEYLKAKKAGSLLRTFVREGDRVVFKTDPNLHDIPFQQSISPTYDGLPVRKYLSLCELPNPMHRLWSDGQWNKLTVAHGCYWKKCSFCDITLDYIGRYEPQTGAAIVDRMEKLMAETGSSGFHFVDEAAPPKSLVAIAQEILKRGLVVTWWGNIRFESTFTPQVATLLAQSGCIAVSGGLEVASDRLLALMEKGVTVDQVARVTHAFSEAGVMVHAYLMYGFPTQTVQETIDSLERVRQLFEAGCIQSAFWHRFSVTVHSPVGKDPKRYGIELRPVPSTFAQNDVPFFDPTGVEHDLFQPGLRKALYNFMHGIGIEEDVRSWFEFPVPKASVPRNWIRRALAPAKERSEAR